MQTRTEFALLISIETVLTKLFNSEEELDICEKMSIAHELKTMVKSNQKDLKKYKNDLLSQHSVNSMILCEISKYALYLFDSVLDPHGLMLLKEDHDIVSLAKKIFPLKDNTNG